MAWYFIYVNLNIGISDDLLIASESFQKNRFQKVVLNGHSIDWLPVKAGARQGSNPGPLLFLMDI